MDPSMPSPVPSSGPSPVPPSAPDPRPPRRFEATALETLWQNPWVRGVTYLVLAVAIVTFLVTQRRSYAFALQVGAIGFLIAYILNPAVEALGRLRIGRGLAVIIIYLILAQAMVFGSVLLTQVVTEIARFINLLPTALSALSSTWDVVGSWIGRIIEVMPAFLQERLGIDPSGEEFGGAMEQQVAIWLTNAAQSLIAVANRIISEGPAFLLAGATSIVSGAFQGLMIVVASAYLLYDFPRVIANARRFVPVRWRPLYGDLVQKADRSIGGYLRGQLLVTILLGFMIWVGLSLIGIPLATAISVLAAVFNLVPYLGPIVGMVPAVLLGLTVSPLAALLAVVVFFAANQIEAHVLAPNILAKSTDLHPVTVLLSILLGAGFLGLVGALLAVPAVAMTKVVLDEYLLQRPAYTEEDEDDPPVGPSPDASVAGA